VLVGAVPIVVAGAVAASCGLTGGDGRITGGTPTVPIPSVNVGRVPFGVYMGPGQPGQVAYFAHHTGAKPSLASDYLPRVDGWGGMVRAKSLRPYLGPWRGAGYRLVLGVPMLPTRDGHVVGTLAAGAAGRYDAEFTTLAKTLVSYGDRDAILRLGWEFNGTWYAWSVTDADAAAQFASYFRHIVAAMRSVPGTSFRFVWNPTSGSAPEASAKSYPGDASVDYVGLDLYDQAWGIPLSPVLAWPTYVSEANGLQWLSSFASSHHKAAVIPEWGVTIRSDGHGLGDDPLFVGEMAQWIATHDVAFTSYFDLNASDGEHGMLDGHFPRALAAFRRSFAASRPADLSPGHK
jgi:hypothetical protein